MRLQGYLHGVRPEIHWGDWSVFGKPEKVAQKSAQLCTKTARTWHRKLWIRTTCAETQFESAQNSRGPAYQRKSPGTERIFWNNFISVWLKNNCLFLWPDDEAVLRNCRHCCFIPVVLTGFRHKTYFRTQKRQFSSCLYTGWVPFPTYSLLIY